MASETSRFHLTTLDSTRDTLAYRSYKFSGADRELLDQLLQQIAENHHHTGRPSTAGDPPPGPPQLSVSPTGGSIPANIAVSYRTAVVATGKEGPGSTAATIFTPAPIFPPDGPRLERAAGVLAAGTYIYALSAYTYDSIRETTEGTAIVIDLVDFGGITVTLPAPPSGATGFNIYRKGPTDRELHFLTSVPADTTTFLDNGSLSVNPLRELPTANTTSTSNSITVRLGSALPNGATWKVFRTYDPSSWDDTLLVWTAEGQVVDTGWGPQSGSPLAGGVLVGSPPKVDLGRDVEGTLPVGQATVLRCRTLTIPGPVTEGPGTAQWVNEYDDLQIIGYRASLAPGSTPAQDAVMVQLDYHDPTGWKPVDPYGGPAIIYPGDQISSAMSVNNGRVYIPGARFRINVLQAGGGTPATDHDLAVTVQFYARHPSRPAPPDFADLRNTATLSALPTATFDQTAGTFQKTAIWTAPAGGYLTGITVPATNPAGWTGAVTLIVSGESRRNRTIIVDELDFAGNVPIGRAPRTLNQLFAWSGTEAGSGVTIPDVAVGNYLIISTGEPYLQPVVDGFYLQRGGPPMTNNTAAWVVTDVGTSPHTMWFSGVAGPVTIVAYDSAPDVGDSIREDVEPDTAPTQLFPTPPSVTATNADSYLGFGFVNAAGTDPSFTPAARTTALASTRAPWDTSYRLTAASSFTWATAGSDAIAGGYDPSSFDSGERLTVALKGYQPFEVEPVPFVAGDRIELMLQPEPGTPVGSTETVGLNVTVRTVDYLGNQILNWRPIGEV